MRLESMSSDDLKASWGQDSVTLAGLHNPGAQHKHLFNKCLLLVYSFYHSWQPSSQTNTIPGTRSLYGRSWRACEGPGARLGAGAQWHGASSAFKDLTSSEGGTLEEKRCSGCDRSHDGDMTSVLGGQETLPQSSDILAGYQTRHRNSLGWHRGQGDGSNKGRDARENPAVPESWRREGAKVGGVSGADWGQWSLTLIFQIIGSHWRLQDRGEVWLDLSQQDRPRVVR